MDISRLLELASTISKSVENIHVILKEETLDAPSFSSAFSTTQFPQLTEIQDIAINAATELRDLLLAPLDLLFQYCGVGLRKTRL